MLSVMHSTCNTKVVSISLNIFNFIQMKKDLAKFFTNIILSPLPSIYNIQIVKR